MEFTDEETAEEAIFACAPIGGMTGLRHLTLDLSGVRRFTSHGVRVGLVDGVLRDGGPLPAQLVTLDIHLSLTDGIRHIATRDLFAAIGRCRALRSLTVDLMRCGMGDRDLARGIVAPLVAGCAALADLSLSIGGGILGIATAERLAALAPRLRSLVLRGMIPESASMARMIRRAHSLHRFEFNARGWISIGADEEDVAPRWPASLGVLRLELSENPTLAGAGHLGALFDRLRFHRAAGGRLTDVHLGLRYTGLTTAHWNDLCAVVGTLPCLRDLHIDVRRNHIARVVVGIDHLLVSSSVSHLTGLRLLFDENPLNSWTEGDCQSMCDIPSGCPRLCVYRLSLRNCSLPYGLTLRLSRSMRETANRHCRISYSF